MVNPDKERKEGNMHIYYNQGKELSVSINSFQMGKRLVDIDYTYYFPSEFPAGQQYNGKLKLEYDDIQWTINTVGDTVERLFAYGEKNMIWNIANAPLVYSPKRIEKAQTILDYVKLKIEEMPPVKEYLDGFLDYCMDYKLQKEKTQQETEKSTDA